MDCTDDAPVPLLHCYHRRWWELLVAALLPPMLPMPPISLMQPILHDVADVAVVLLLMQRTR